MFLCKVFKNPLCLRVAFVAAENAEMSGTLLVMCGFLLIFLHKSKPV